MNISIGNNLFNETLSASAAAVATPLILSEARTYSTFLENIPIDRMTCDLARCLTDATLNEKQIFYILGDETKLDIDLVMKLFGSKHVNSSNLYRATAKYNKAVSKYQKKFDEPKYEEVRKQFAKCILEAAMPPYLSLSVEFLNKTIININPHDPILQSLQLALEDQDLSAPAITVSFLEIVVKIKIKVAVSKILKSAVEKKGQDFGKYLNLGAQNHCVATEVRLSEQDVWEIYVGNAGEGAQGIDGTQNTCRSVVKFTLPDNEKNRETVRKTLVTLTRVKVFCEEFHTVKDGFYKLFRQKFRTILDLSQDRRPLQRYGSCSYRSYLELVLYRLRSLNKTHEANLIHHTLYQIGAEYLASQNDPYSVGVRPLPDISPLAPENLPDIIIKYKNEELLLENGSPEQLRQNFSFMKAFGDPVIERILQTELGQGFEGNSLENKPYTLKIVA